MVKSKRKIFRIYTRLKYKNSILGISTLVFSIKCDICLTNLQEEMEKFKKAIAFLFDLW